MTIRTDSDISVDYPDFVLPAARSVSDGTNDLGVVFGGSGNGEAIAANKVEGIRCGLCWDTWSAEMTKKHNNANVIALGGRVVDSSLALTILDTWLDTEFEGGRHTTRIEKIEGEQDVAPQSTTRSVV